MADPLSPSPLGHYGAGSRDGELREVRLTGVPVELYVATRQQHDELMREFAVMALAHRDEQSAVPEGLRHLIGELGVHYAPSGSRTDEEMDAAFRAGRQIVDVGYSVSESVIAAANELETLMASADEFCRRGRMLTMPRSPLVRQFSAWWLQELRRQVAGLPPLPWSGPVPCSGQRT